MILRRDGDVELLQPRQMIGPADERMFDRPASADDRAIAVGGFVGVEHAIDGGIAHRMSRHAPAPEIERAHDLSNVRGSTVCSPLNVPPSSNGGSIEVAHQPAFESAVHSELDPADTQPFVPFVHANARLVERTQDGAGVSHRAEQRMHSHAQDAAALHLLERAIVFDRHARVTDGRQPDRM